MRGSQETIVFNPESSGSDSNQGTQDLFSKQDHAPDAPDAPDAPEFDFKLPTITYHEVPLQFGLNAAHAATIDCGFGLPDAWNLVEPIVAPQNALSPNSEDQTPPPTRLEASHLQNSQTLQDQMIAIARAKAEASLHIRQNLALRGCKNVDLTFDRVTYVNGTGKVVSGFYVLFTGTLE
jgi:hypothetical protein